MVSDTGILVDYVDRPTLAAELGCSTRTLKRYEDRPDGLPNLMVGGRKLYRRNAVREWLAAQERRPNPRRERQRRRRSDG